MNNKIAITGVNGFVGEHLARHLKQQGFFVVGIGREPVLNDWIKDLVDDYQIADLMDAESTAKLDITGVKAIIHLAGFASVADSFKQPELYETGNAQITANVLQLALDQTIEGRVVVISSGALYDPTQPLPISEDSKTLDNSPYAVGKLRAEDVTREFIGKGVDAVIVRPFNHVGPHQAPGFLIPDLYEELAGIEKSGLKQIKVGNLNTKRDYTDVRDVVAAYTLLGLADSLEHDLYNVATGESHSGVEVLHTLKTAMGLTGVETVIDPERIRPNDIMDVVGDASRLRSELGWAPKSNVFSAINDFVASKRAA